MFGCNSRCWVMEVGVVTVVVMGVVLGCLAPPTAAFNLDPRASYVLQEPWSAVRMRESYFGYSVALYASGGEAMALVGAPRANTTLWEWSAEEIPEPGALYVCPLSDATTLECRQILVDNSGNEYFGSVVGQPYQNRFNHGWLGVTLDLHHIDNTDLVATCGHRWINQLFASKDDYFMNGVCYWAFFGDLLNTDFSHNSWEKLLPLLENDKQRIVDPFTGDVYYYYQLGQTGTSAHILNDGSGLLMGTPGVKNWAGTVAWMRKEGDPGIIDSRGARSPVYTLTDVITPSMLTQLTDYVGYSVTSGRFWGGQDSFVAGAPRADFSGKVYIFKTRNSQMEVEWIGVGAQVGSGYGSAVAAGDVDGDGLSELFVGVPLVSLKVASKGGNEEAPEAGEVVVYTASGAGVSSFAAMTVLRGAPSSPGARFGSSITVLGDLDRDGFQDVAVGAPYEIDGLGAVYIYRGSAYGLVSEASQKILATDVNLGLRAFGMALSRGADVDFNGYVDLAVGAYGGGGGVAVLRARPAVRVAGEVVSGVAILTEAGTPFSATVCVNYTGYNAQPDTIMEMVVRVDEGYAAPRAVFLDSGSSEVRMDASVQIGKNFCKVFSLILKDELQDFEHPLDLTFHYQSEDFDPASPWCKTCGVVAPGSTSSARTSVPLALGCGSDGVCSPRLRLQAEWTSGLNDGRYTVGSGVGLTLRVVVRAEEEPAYLGKVFVDLPQGLSVRSFPYSCSPSTTRRVTCTLINPLHQREEEVILVLQEEEEGQLEDQEMVEVEVSAQASGADTQKIKTQLLLHRDVQLVLTVYTDDDFLYYNESSPTPQVLTDITIQAENRGPTRVTEITVEVLVPLAYSPPDEDLNITFGAITQVSVIPESGINICRVGSLDIIAGGVGVAVDGEIETPPAGIPLVATCAVRGMLCGRFLCNLGDLNQDPRISLKTNYNLTYLIDKYGKNSSVSIHIWSTITAPTTTGTSNPRAGVWLGLVPDGWQHPTLVPKDAPVWVYIVGVLVGLVILIIIVVILFKVGFFNRRRPEGKASPSGERNLEDGDQATEEEEESGLPQTPDDADDIEDDSPPPESHEPFLQEDPGPSVDLK